MANIDFNTAAQLSLYGGLLIVLAISSVTDVTQRRIPNLLTGPTILAALLAYGLLGGMDGLLFSLGGLAFGLGIFLVPYFMGGMGAGDVKLMGGVGAVLGPAHTGIALLFIAVCGGCMALGMMLYRGILRQTLSNLCVSLLFFGAHKDASLLKVDKNARTQAGIPYALAITSGVCLFFIYLLINEKSLPGFAVG